MIDIYCNIISSIDSNPPLFTRYLALAAIVAAGAHGIVTNQILNMRDLNTTTAAELSDNERANYGITQRMSRSIDEARTSLEGDGVLREMMGEEFVDAYLRVNKVRTRHSRHCFDLVSWTVLIASFD